MCGVLLVDLYTNPEDKQGQLHNASCVRFARHMASHNERIICEPRPPEQLLCVPQLSKTRPQTGAET